MVTARDADRIAIESLVCPRCEALPGSPCRTISGGRASNVHTSRMRPLNEAWRDGYAAGAYNVLTTVLARAEKDSWLADWATKMRPRYDARTGATP